MEKFLKKENLRVAVIGSGSWATALAKLLLTNKGKISWYIRNSDSIEHFKATGHNPKYLTEVQFDPQKIHFSSDINEIVNEADILVFSIPSAYFLQEVEKISISLDKKFLVSAIKGIVPGHNLTIAEYFHEIHGIPFSRIGVISGPCHAEEIVMEKLSYLTLSSKHLEVADDLCALLKCDYIRTIAGTDIYGVEYAAVLKNIYAVAAGVCHSLSYGDNFMAVLITNSFHEMRRFLRATHPDENRKTSKSAYLGDLLVTCYSQFSRNRTFGSMIGKGYSVKSAQIEMNMVAEGYFATKCIYQMNQKYKVNMPIAEAMYNILYEGRNPAIIIKQLTNLLQ